MDSERERAVAEIRYKIRSLSQSLTEQGEMFSDIRERVNICLQNPERDLKGCTELFHTLHEITRDTNSMMKELRDAFAEYQGLMETPE